MLKQGRGEGSELDAWSWPWTL